MSTKRQVFISTSSKSDMLWVRELADILSHNGLTVWLDHRDFTAGEAWEKRLEEALRSSDAVLFVISGDNLERSNLFFELGFAKALGKQSVFIVPGNHDISWIPSDLRDEELVVKKSPDETAAALVATLRSEAGDIETMTLSRNTKEIDFTNSLPRLACVLVLDTSGSMAGQPITNLNEAFDSFKSALRSDAKASRQTDLAVITFGGQVTIAQPFSTPSESSSIELVASGATEMGRALKNAVDMISERKLEYKSAGIRYYRPWIVLITDGSPTDPWEQAAARIRKGVSKGKFAFIAIGVEGADMETLAQIAPPESPARRLRGLDFHAFFQWVSSSISRVTSGTPDEIIALPPVDWSIDI